MSDSDNTKEPSETPQEKQDPREAVASRGLREGAVPRDVEVAVEPVAKRGREKPRKEKPIKEKRPRGRPKKLGPMREKRPRGRLKKIREFREKGPVGRPRKGTA